MLVHMEKTVRAFPLQNYEGQLDTFLYSQYPVQICFGRITWRGMIVKVSHENRVQLPVIAWAVKDKAINPFLRCSVSARSEQVS